MSDEKTGGFWDSYRRVMTYKTHFFRFLVVHPFMIFSVCLLLYLFGVNPLEDYPYVFFATIIVMILASEGLAFVVRKYDYILVIHNPFIRRLHYLLSGIMYTAISVYFSFVTGAYMYVPPILGVKPIIFWGICHTILFIIVISISALAGERRVVRWLEKNGSKKIKLNT